MARAAGPAYSWNGCYLGAEAGAATSTSRWTYTHSNAYSSTGDTDPQLVSGANFKDNRGIIGFQAGCNRAVSDWWVVGIEGSWFSNPMNSRNNNGGFFPDPAPVLPYKEMITTNIQSVLSLTGRLGVAVTPDWLVYAKGGYAVAKIQTAGTVSPALFPPTFDFNTTEWHSGWTAGAGVEYRLFRNVTIGAEYDYYSFANVTHSGITAITSGGVPVAPIDHRVNADVQTLMARVNFAFDPGLWASDAGANTAYAAAPPVAQPVSSYSAFSTNEVKYSSWNGTRGANVFAPDRGSGYQVYSPTTIGIDFSVPSQYKLETRLKGGYVYSVQKTAGQEAHYEGPVDTQASFNLTLLSFDSIRPLLGLSLNLPTGNSYLPGNQRFTRMDPDLVDAGSYGAGFNINPTAGFILGLNQTTAVSLSVGYAWQGDFTKEGISTAIVPNPAPPPLTFESDTFDLKQKVSPGNTYTVNGNISSTLGNLNLIASFAYMGDSHASIDGVATGKAGAKFTANGTANWRIDNRWALSTNVSWNFSEKNQIADGFGGLVGELQNSNSNVVIGSVEPSYLVSEKLRLAANYSFLWRDHNSYDPFQDLFVPAKQKHLVGASATYALTQTASITARASHAWIRQEDGPLLLTETGPPVVLALSPPMLTYDVWAASIGGTMRF